MSSFFCSLNCERPVDTQRNDGYCCQQCRNSSGNTNNHGPRCDQLYNEYLITQFTQNDKNLITQKWECSICTLQNDSFRTKCQICDAPKSQNKQPPFTNIDPDISMISISPSKTMPTRKRKRHEMSADSDSEDDDIIILNHCNKKRKTNEKYENINTNHNHFKQNKMEFMDVEEEEISDPRLNRMKIYHKKRESMIDIPDDYVIDYDLIDNLNEKLQCFHHEQLIRMEQDKKFKCYKKKIKKLNDEINQTPQQVFNYKINEYYVHEHTQIIQMQRIRINNTKNYKLPFSEDDKVLLFCSCCLNKVNKPKVLPKPSGSEDKKSKLTQEQIEMIERKKLAALERRRKNGLENFSFVSHKQNTKNIKVDHDLEVLLQQKLVLYGTINEVTIDNKLVNIVLRIKKFDKYLTEYGADNSETTFHNKPQCHFYIVKELNQFGTFGLQLKSIETFFCSTVLQLGTSWCNKYYNIDQSIGNAAPLLTKNEIITVLKQQKTLKMLHFPLDIIRLIVDTFIGESQDYLDIEEMNPDLNGSQIRAIYNASQNAVSVIQGPPGTGKTYTAVNIVQRFFSQVTEHEHERKRAILTAHTNAACDQLLKQMVAYTGTKNLELTRFCNQSRMKLKDLMHFSHREKMKNHHLYAHMQQLFMDAKNRLIARAQREIARTEAKQLEQLIIQDILKQSDVIILTCFAAAGYILARSEINFELIIIDESTQIIEPEVLGVINLLNEHRSSIGAMKWKHRLKNAMKNCCDNDEVDEFDQFDEYKYEHEPVLGKFSDGIDKIRNFNKKIVMIGDPKQLSPVITSNEAEHAGHGITWFHRILAKLSMTDLMNFNRWNRYKCMSDDNEIFTMLNVQYRGWDILHEFNSIQFYHGKLKHDQIWNESEPKLKQLIGGFDWQNNKPFNFVAINSKQRPSKGNYENVLEAKCVTNIVRNILVYGNDKRVNDREDVLRIKSLKQIGIITMHVQQVILLQNEIKHAFGKDIAKDLIVSTVDAFQGQEKELIILSLCRTDCWDTTFMRDEKRINVSLSRAKKAMIIVGNLKQFNVNRIFDALRQYLADHDVIKICS